MSIEYYNNNSDLFYQNTINADVSEIRNKFLKYLEGQGKILDAGCGSGRDTLEFMKLGYDVTAFDGSLEMVKLSSNLTGKSILHIKFQDVNFNKEFDGVWACASVLHVSKSEISLCISKLLNSLKEGGFMYASFKYGDEEYLKDGRVFNCYTDESVKDLFAGSKIIEVWKTKDVREGREDEYWINVIVKKN